MNNSKIRIFKNRYPAVLEACVNEFLEKAERIDLKILEIQFSATADDVCAMIIYQDQNYD